MRPAVHQALVWIVLLGASRTGYGVQSEIGDKRPNDIFSRLPSRRLHLAYYPQVQGTNGGGQTAAYYPYGGGGAFQYQGAQQGANVLQQPLSTVSPQATFNSIPLSSNPLGGAGTFSSQALGSGVPSFGAGGLGLGLPLPTITPVVPGDGLVDYSDASIIDTARSIKDDARADKRVDAVQDLRFLDQVRKGLTKKKRYIQQGIIAELNRSPLQDAGVLTLQKNTNYAYQSGDDVVNVATNKGVQKQLGPTPSTLSPEQLYQEGFQQGLNQGVLQGVQTGYNAGFEMGFRQGYEQGFDQGVNQGVFIGVEAVLAEPNDDPTFQEGYQQGFEVGLSQGYAAGREVRQQILHSPDSTVDHAATTGPPGDETPSAELIAQSMFDQEARNSLAEEALIRYMQEVGMLDADRQGTESEDATDAAQSANKETDLRDVKESPQTVLFGEVANRRESIPTNAQVGPAPLSNFVDSEDERGFVGQGVNLHAPKDRTQVGAAAAAPRTSPYPGIELGIGSDLRFVLSEEDILGVSKQAAATDISQAATEINPLEAIAPETSEEGFGSRPGDGDIADTGGKDDEMWLLDNKNMEGGEDAQDTREDVEEDPLVVKFEREEVIGPGDNVPIGDVHLPNSFFPTKPNENERSNAQKDKRESSVNAKIVIMIIAAGIGFVAASLLFALFFIAYCQRL